MVHDLIIFKPTIRMKELTIKDKIQILKDGIKYLKNHTCVGMCAALSRSINKYPHRMIIPYSTLDYYYPDFTHNNYLKFYRYNKSVKQCENGRFWDDCYSIFGMKRRIIFLRYLILKLRIQQFKQWYTTLR